MNDEISGLAGGQGSGHKKKNSMKLSPFKKAQDVLKRKFSGNFDNSDEIFNEHDCVDPTSSYYRR